MEEGYVPSALEDGSALRAPPTALALVLGVGSVLEEREGEEDTIAVSSPIKQTKTSGVVWFAHGFSMNKPHHSTSKQEQSGLNCSACEYRWHNVHQTHMEWWEEVLTNAQGPTTCKQTSKPLARTRTNKCPNKPLVCVCGVPYGTLRTTHECAW